MNILTLVMVILAIRNAVGNASHRPAGPGHQLMARAIFLLDSEGAKAEGTRQACQLYTGAHHRIETRGSRQLGQLCQLRRAAGPRIPIVKTVNFTRAPASPVGRMATANFATFVNFAERPGCATSSGKRRAGCFEPQLCLALDERADHIHHPRMIGVDPAALLVGE